MSSTDQWFRADKVVPADGVTVLVCTPDVDDGMTLGTWFDSHAGAPCGEWLSMHGETIDVTHWTHLPLPPADAAICTANPSRRARR